MTKSLRDRIDGQAREIRMSLKGPELRAADGSEGVRVEGYAAVFNQIEDMAGYFEERIAPGAFSAALSRGDDVPFLVNHRGLPLARTASGTLELREDERGLWIGSDLDPEDPDVCRIVPKMRRGDLSKMSFAFHAKRTTWDETRDVALRTIEEVELLDVAIVTTPGYAGTEIALRGLDLAGLSAGREASRREHVAAMRRRGRLSGL